MAGEESGYVCLKNGEIFTASTELAIVKLLSNRFFETLREAATSADHAWVTIEPLDLTGAHASAMSQVLEAVQRRDELPERTGELVWGIAHRLPAVEPAVGETWAQGRCWVSMSFLHGWTSMCLDVPRWAWCPYGLFTEMRCPDDVARWIRENFDPPDDRFGDPYDVAVTGSRQLGSVPSTLGELMGQLAVSGSGSWTTEPALLQALYRGALPRLRLFARLYLNDATLALDAASRAFERAVVSASEMTLDACAFHAVRQIARRERRSMRRAGLTLTTAVTGLRGSQLDALSRLNEETIEVFLLRSQRRCALSRATTARVLEISESQVRDHEWALISAGCVDPRRPTEGST